MDKHEPLAARVHQRTLEVGILLFPEVEILDFAGPYEVFSVAARVARRDRLLAHDAFRLRSIAAERTLIRARHGLRLMADADFADEPACDLLIVPGGVVDQPLSDPATLAWVRQAAAQAAVTASVCTGAFILAEAGLLAGQRVTTHWEDIADLRSRYPDLTVAESVPFVDLGATLTSAGISAGIAMSLHLVARILGPQAARATARQMQYDWTDSVQPLGGG
ncbi:DJ-1/PfpI family protein [Pseudomonas zhanjiangensis]|uniref:DJ-1/PfpI family protein n=1 Tax=Pseudomonas zhanjiangensis TaxID=3239015 RepID=A0ABV3YXL4_9PSED